jgi:hypothetical protein
LLPICPSLKLQIKKRGLIDPMLTVLLFVFGFGHIATRAHPDTDETPPSLIVQVVDPVYIPLPESEVTVKLVSVKGFSKPEHVDQDGYVRFWVEPGKQYVIEAKAPTFKKKSLKVSIGQPKSAIRTAHVQIMLKSYEGSFSK